MGEVKRGECEGKLDDMYIYIYAYTRVNDMMILGYQC